MTAVTFRSAPPQVTLVNCFARPFENAIATARTCYSANGIITPEQVATAPELRDRIAASTYEAGHHTTLQHAHAQFAITNVSRQFIWTFLHSHPFYNCIAGETEIPSLHNNETTSWTIKALYEAQHDPVRRRYVKIRRVPSVDDGGNLVPNQIERVVFTGMKTVYRVTTGLGHVIRATQDHRFMREDGSWARLHELEPGDNILVNATPRYKGGARRLELHPVDGDLLHSDADNARLLCSLPHKAARSPDSTTMPVTVDSIAAIEHDGETDTYDLVMAGPHHNFVANGFVVHNSEQVSQRYVRVHPDAMAVPPLEAEALAIYERTLTQQTETYQRLIELLTPAVESLYFEIFPSRAPRAPRPDAPPVPHPMAKRWIPKKAQEVARYVLPVATFAYLYHTISILTLLRYYRICQQPDAPLETRSVVQAMIDQLLAFDPLFETILEQPLPLEATLEARFWAGPGDTAHQAAFVREFDAALEGRTSKLVSWKPDNEALLAQAVREVLGVPRTALADEQAIALVLDPASNSYFGEALNVTSMSKLSRTMVHPQYTFRKKLSHTADSQDQRHRMTPGSRPLLYAYLGDEPDYITPALVRLSQPALRLYDETMTRTWEAIRRLRAFGTTPEYCAYLLPNAVAVRFTESADLLSLHHKLKMRLCYNAQEEIFAASKDEALQIQRVNPTIGRYLGAPCTLRRAAGARPYCPEGDRFCGVPVWKLAIAEYERIL
ncbi:MAG TPA: hypothetical protein DEP84_32135 [Chloroflexi bacterium]|nr:hypothetical protein [Chloroflexota bacterium]